MKIILPLPSKKLSPNASRGRSKGAICKRAAIVREHRNCAKLMTLAALDGKPAPVFTRYRLAFFFKEQRNRDDDNAAASCKAYRDGIADALRIDDHTLRMDGAPELLIDRKKPRLEFTLIP